MTIETRAVEKPAIETPAIGTLAAANGLALETRGLCKSFGALTVADQINFRLERGARQALIGPNGAGKTTFVELVTGGLRPSRSEEHTSELQSHVNLVCRLLLEKKKKKQ